MIKLTNAYKEYKNGKQTYKVINNTNISFPNTGLVTIFGPSGCGKTTLLNVIGGLDKLDKGSVFIDEKNILEDTNKLRNRYVGYIFQNYLLNNKYTVLENVMHALMLCGIKDKEVLKSRSMQALKNVDMEHFASRMPDTLSGGQMQRVAIARAIVKSPKVILADEPTGNLDEINTHKVMDLLRALADNCLVILVTHETDIVKTYSDLIIEIKDGQVISQKTNTLITKKCASKNKNNIYLGELDKQNIKLDNMNIDYYSNNQEELNIKIVNVDGLIYIDSLNSKIKLINNQTETVLIDGKFEETKNLKQIDIKEMPYIEGKKIGSLYTFIDTIKSTLKDFLSLKKKTKLNIFLQFILSIILVFSIGLVGIDIKDYQECKNQVIDNTLLLKINENTDEEKVNNILNTPHVTNQYFLRNIYEVEIYSLKVTNFASVLNREIDITTKVLPSFFASNNILYGNKPKNENEILISTALAEQIIENHDLNILNSFDDIIKEQITLSHDDNMKIVGITDDLFDALFISTNYLYKTNLEYETFDTISKLNNYTLNNNEIAISSSLNASKSIGDTIKVRGKNYTIKYIFSDQLTINYQEYLNKEFDIPDFNTYKSSSESLIDSIESYSNILFDNNYLEDFIKLSFITNSSNLEYLTGYYTKDLLTKALCLTNNNEIIGYYYYLEKNNKKPTESELFNFINDINFEELKYSVKYIDEVQDFSLESLGYKNYFFSTYSYNNLLQTYGKTDYEMVDYRKDDITYYDDAYLLIKTNNEQDTINYLKENFNSDLIYDQTKQIKLHQDNEQINIIFGIGRIVIIVIILSISIYLMMRAKFFLRIKEIGINRAIGVSKRNIIYHYFLESTIRSIFSILLGYMVGVIIISNLSKHALFNTILYFPATFGFISFLIIFSLSIFFGILPAINLLKKTPKEILTKYEL